MGLYQKLAFEMGKELAEKIDKKLIELQNSGVDINDLTLVFLPPKYERRDNGDFIVHSVEIRNDINKKPIEQMQEYDV